MFAFKSSYLGSISQSLNSMNGAVVEDRFLVGLEANIGDGFLFSLARAEFGPNELANLHLLMRNHF
jgi:hypothetical protein